MKKILKYTNIFQMIKLTDYIDVIYVGVLVKTHHGEEAVIVQIQDNAIIVKTQKSGYYLYTNSILYMLNIIDINFINDVRIKKLKNILDEKY